MYTAVHTCVNAVMVCSLLLGLPFIFFPTCGCRFVTHHSEICLGIINYITNASGELLLLQPTVTVLLLVIIVLGVPSLG